MFSNEKMRAEKCGELKLKTDFLATFGQPKPGARWHDNGLVLWINQTPAGPADRFVQTSLRRPRFVLQ